MAVRRGCGGGAGSPSPTLVAVAGPAGISISELGRTSALASASSSRGGLRAWMVLDYSSGDPSSSPPSSRRNRGGGGRRGHSGGVSCMSFQPSSSGGGGASSSSVLLAAARGSGILLYDCSGRALSPLLGRLDACRRRTGAAAVAGGSGSADGGAVGAVGAGVHPPPRRLPLIARR